MLQVEPVLEMYTKENRNNYHIQTLLMVHISHTFSNSEVHLKGTLSQLIYLFSDSKVYILEVDFHNLCYYCLTQKYIWCRLSKLLCLHSTFVFPPRHWNTGLVSSRASLTSWGEGVYLALVGNPSSDGVIIKMPYRVDVYINQLHIPFFPTRLVKTESGFTVRSVETAWGNECSW